MANKRVVITGVGIISPLGNSLDLLWEGLSNGKSGISQVESMDTEGYPCTIAGEVKDFDPEPWFTNPKEINRTDRFTKFGIAASKMAIQMSGIDDESLNKDNIGVMVGSGIGGLHTLEEQYSIYSDPDKGLRRMSPFMIPMMISNICSGMVSMEYGFKGPNMAIVTACATANHNIGEAWRMIQFGDAEAFVAGGTEATICPMGLGGFGRMRALSTRNDNPTRASRPFDVGRDGFIMGEGAGVVVVESLEHATKRGANILCELTGYGLSADAHHLTAPHPEGEGASRCMDMALKHSGLNPQDIDYVNAHGTSTPQGDVCETEAIKRTFGSHAKDGLLVSSTKSMTGHLLGAAGGIEIAACIETIRNGVIAPTINLEEQDPNCDLNYCANEAREVEVKHALSNSFGFGGHNASVIVSKFEG